MGATPGDEPATRSFTGTGTSTSERKEELQALEMLGICSSLWLWWMEETLHHLKTMVYAMICRVSTILLVVQDWLQASNIVRYGEINMDEFLTRLWLQKITSLPEMDRVRDMIVAVMKAREYFWITDNNWHYFPQSSIRTCIISHRFWDCHWLNKSKKMCSRN